MRSNRHLPTPPRPEIERAKGTRNEALIRLTGQSERDDLNACLLSIVSELYGPENVNLFGLFDSEGTKEFSAENLAGARARNMLGGNDRTTYVISESEAFTKCIELNDIVITEKDQSVIVCHPLRRRIGVMGLIVIEYHSHDRIVWDEINLLLEIYCNQCKLLNTIEYDALTGLLNRKSFDKHVLSAISSLKQPRPAEEISGDPCFAIFDIDHFKEVNDNYGHLHGDEVLLRFAQIMQSSFRHYDLIFRYGGEEFCIILFDGDERVCESIMERFRLKLESFNFPQVGRKTVSIGYTMMKPSDQPDELFRRADQALYYAKENGRNQVCQFERLCEQGVLIEDENEADIELF